METLQKNPEECFFEIVERIENTPTTTTKKILYVQNKNTKINKLGYEKLQAWTEKVLKNDLFSEFTKTAPMQDGITFDEGILEQNIKSKILFNKEKILRQKFEKEHEDRDKTSKKGLKDLTKGERKEKERVKVSGVMFFEENIEEQKQTMQKLIFNCTDKIRNDLNLDRIFFNKNSFFRFDRNNEKKILDYLILNFDETEIASRFCIEIQGKMFNRCMLHAEILPRRIN
jgi:hypothetical protein